MKVTNYDASGKEFDPAEVILPADLSQRILDGLPCTT